MASFDPAKDYYKVLGVENDATSKEIQKAFLQGAFKTHPDRNKGHEEEAKTKFQMIHEAKEILSNPTERVKYDAARRKLMRKIPPIPPYNSRPTTAPQRGSYATTPGGTYYGRPHQTRAQPNPPRPTPQKHQSSFYNNGAHRFTQPNFQAPPTAQKHKEPEPKPFTAWQKMKNPRPEQPRGSNTNSPNGTPFGRSKDSKPPSERKGFDPGTPGEDEGQAKSSYRSSYQRPAPSPATGEDTYRSPKTQPEAEDVPFAEANRFRTPYWFTKSGERTFMYGDGIGRSSSVRNSPTHAQRFGAHDDAGFNSDSGHHRPQRNSYAAPGKDAKFPYMYESSDEEEAEVFRTGTKHRGPPPPQPQHSQQKSAPANGSPSNPLKSKSEENINMKFSPSDWHGKFVGRPEDYFAPNIAKGSTTKGRTSPTRGRHHQRSTTDKGLFTNGQSQPPPVSSFSRPQSSHMPPPPPGPPPNMQEPHATKFAPEQWAETFKEPSWAFPSNVKETSPRRGSAATKRATPARKPTGASENNGGVGKQASKPKPKYQASAEDAPAEDAMDIDSEPPPATKASMPESTGTSTTANGNVGASPAAPASKFATSGLDLNGMKTVEPFAPTGAGLGGFDGLRDQLPFPSEASNAHPTKPNTAQKLKFPIVPLAPIAPTTLDRSTTDAYFKQMEGYVRQFNQYRTAITAHFAARIDQLHNLDDNFVSQRGERTQKLGFASYLQKMREDEGVLEAWKIAHEFHIKALEQCEDVRRKAAKQQKISSV